MQRVGVLPNREPSTPHLHQNPILNLKLTLPAVPSSGAHYGWAVRPSSWGGGLSWVLMHSGLLEQGWETLLGGPLGKVKSSTQQVGGAWRRKETNV